jgi:hypothetical protein
VTTPCCALTGQCLACAHEPIVQPNHFDFVPSRRAGSDDHIDGLPVRNSRFDRTAGVAPCLDGERRAFTMKAHARLLTLGRCGGAVHHDACGTSPLEDCEKVRPRGSSARLSDRLRRSRCGLHLLGSRLHPHHAHIEGPGHGASRFLSPAGSGASTHAKRTGTTAALRQPMSCSLARRSSRWGEGASYPRNRRGVGRGHPDLRRARATPRHPTEYGWRLLRGVREAWGSARRVGFGSGAVVRVVGTVLAVLVIVAVSCQGGAPFRSEPSRARSAPRPHYSAHFRVPLP